MKTLLFSLVFLTSGIAFAAPVSHTFNFEVTGSKNVVDGITHITNLKIKKNGRDYDVSSHSSASQICNIFGLRPAAIFSIDEKFSTFKNGSLEVPLRLDIGFIRSNDMTPALMEGDVDNAIREIRCIPHG
jgi:hypothetical protein